MAFKGGQPANPTGKKRRKPKDIADDVLDATDVAEGRKQPDEAAEPAVAPDSALGAEFVKQGMRRIRYLQGSRAGKCSIVGYKLASAQVAMGRAEYVDK